MEHVSAPLARGLGRLVPVPVQPFYRCEHGLIFNRRGEVISPDRARALIEANRDLAMDHVKSSGAVDVRADLIRIHLRTIDELSQCIAQAEAYEPEPHVLASPGSAAGVSEQGRAA